MKVHISEQYIWFYPVKNSFVTWLHASFVIKYSNWCFKARVDSLLVAFLTCMQIHLFCTTCWSLDGQHCSKVFWSTCLYTNKDQIQDQVCTLTIWGSLKAWWQICSWWISKKISTKSSCHILFTKQYCIPGYFEGGGASKYFQKIGKGNEKVWY